MTADTWTWALTTGDDTDALQPPDGAELLSSRQEGILMLVADGCTDAEIGRAMWISEHTVKTHLCHAYSTLGARNRAHAVAIALRKGLIR